MIRQRAPLLLTGMSKSTCSDFEIRSDDMSNLVDGNRAVFRVEELMRNLALTVVSGSVNPVT